MSPKTTLKRAVQLSCLRLITATFRSVLYPPSSPSRATTPLRHKGVQHIYSITHTTIYRYAIIRFILQAIHSICMERIITTTVLLASYATIAVLTIGAQSAFAISDFESGFQHGGADGYDKCQHPDGCHWYILQPGKSFKFHSREFVIGYVTGWCSVPGNENSGSDSVVASWDCRLGPTSGTYVVCGNVIGKDCSNDD